MLTMSTSCPRCNATNTTAARFCNQCSAPLTQPCPHCGQSQSVAAKFCSVCGTALALVASQAAVLSPQPLTGRLPANAVIAGRYVVMQKLGQGGMGAVYLVSDQRLANKPHALKEMSDQALADPAERQAALQAFRQEADMLALLDHPNLPKVTDYFTEAGNQYLVMEYVQGSTLEKKLEQTRGPLPEPVVRKYADQLCDVLGYLHRRQPPIVFRDLKPANIMVQTDGRLRLIDFGIARHFKPGKSKDTQAMGTPGYAAPEQYGKGQSDSRTDVYALGATLHHMLTGRDPSSDPFQFPSARSLNPGLSASIDQIVARAVALDPNQRWPTIGDLHHALLGQTVGAASGIYPGATLVTSQPAPTAMMAGRAATQLSLAPVQPSPQLPSLAPTQLPALRGAAPPPMPVPGYVMSIQGGLLGNAYAGYGKRVAAFFLDGFLCYLLAILLAALVGGFMAAGGSSSSAIGGSFLLVMLVSGWLYYIWPTAKNGQTLGKKMLGIKVVDANGAPPGWGKAFRRYVLGFGLENLLMYVFIGLIGWLWPLWDANKQAWHDKIGSTYVVDK